MTEQSSDPTARISLPTPPDPPAAAPPPPTADPASADARRATARPPAWAPASRRDDGGRLGSVAFGLLILAIGLWFFAAETLGLDMPDISWRQAWPVILIAIGTWIVLGQVRRSR